MHVNTVNSHLFSNSFGVTRHQKIFLLIFLVGDYFSMSGGETNHKLLSKEKRKISAGDLGLVKFTSSPFAEVLKMITFSSQDTFEPT